VMGSWKILILASLILTQALASLGLMNAHHCGFRHERREKGDYGTVCSDVLRDVSLVCAHSNRTPFLGVTRDLVRFGFLTEAEGDDAITIIAGQPIAQADQAASLMYGVLEFGGGLDPASQATAHERGIRISLEQLSESQVHRESLRLQAQASQEIRNLHAAMRRGLEKALELVGGLHERIVAFRGEFVPSFGRL